MNEYMTENHFKNLPDRQNMLGLPEIGRKYRDSAHPNTVFIPTKKFFSGSDYDWSNYLWQAFGVTFTEPEKPAAPVIDAEELEAEIKADVRKSGKANICIENNGCVHAGKVCSTFWCEVRKLEILDGKTPKPPVEVTMQRVEAELAEIQEQLQAKDSKNVIH